MNADKIQLLGPIRPDGSPIAVWYVGGESLQFKEDSWKTPSCECDAEGNMSHLHRLQYNGPGEVTSLYWLLPEISVFDEAQASRLCIYCEAAEYGVDLKKLQLHEQVMAASRGDRNGVSLWRKQLQELFEDVWRSYLIKPAKP